ncbi:hypothetical protein ACQ4OD_17950 [Pseudomonas sp. WC1]|uniref:hypothetical protein n=1 Tax=Pseudomonas sp. WC1 TaxID=3424772 RepID=UPI003D345316
MQLKRSMSGVLLATGCIISLLPVLYVNDGLDLFESTQSLGTPRIEIHVDDACNSVAEVTAMMEVLPFQSALTIQALPSEHPSCSTPPYALITTENLVLHLEEGRIIPRGFSLNDGPSIVTRGTLKRAMGESSSFAVHLAGDVSNPQGSFRLAADAMDAGFGQVSAQVQLATRNLRCQDAVSGQPNQNGKPDDLNCGPPLRGALLYVSSVFELTSALPPVQGLSMGPNIGRGDDVEHRYFATTRLSWSGKPTARSSDIQGALTGFEIHLQKRHSVAQRLFVTISCSTLFGAFLSMLMGLFMPPAGTLSTHDSDGPVGTPPSTLSSGTPEARVPAEEDSTIAPTQDQDDKSS